MIYFLQVVFFGAQLTWIYFTSQRHTEKAVLYLLFLQLAICPRHYAISLKSLLQPNFIVAGVCL